MCPVVHWERKELPQAIQCSNYYNRKEKDWRTQGKTLENIVLVQNKLIANKIKIVNEDWQAKNEIQIDFNFSLAIFIIVELFS
jgi:hypothetical protein